MLCRTFLSKTTIAALSTPPGIRSPGRRSGERARHTLRIAADVFHGRRELLETLGGFEGAHGWFVGSAGPVDEVVVWVYRAPRSYTGEDMVEFACHGGSVSARRILETLWEKGARPAEPGEFTRRAFLNGRLDLAQAEAVADLIAARGRRAQEIALTSARGWVVPTHR